MKKLFAAILAVAMLVTCAFAADYKPGEKAVFTGAEADWDVKPTDTLTSENYFVSDSKWTKGGDMVSTVKILSSSDGGSLVVTLKQNYTTTNDKALEGTITVRQKGSTAIHILTVKSTVGYDAETINIGSNGEIDTVSPVKDTVYTVTKAEGGKTYGVMTMVAEGVEVSVRVYDGEKFYLASDTTPDKAILLANTDNDADPTFLNFVASPTFSSTATISFFGLKKDSIIYELADGKLTKTAAVWDAESEVWTLKTKTLSNYVISDAELKSATGTTNNGSGSSGSDADKNPATGANDIVGIASALAAVAVISAAAISLKK